jgi:hypothetical protein
VEDPLATKGSEGGEIVMTFTRGILIPLLGALIVGISAGALRSLAQTHWREAKGSLERLSVFAFYAWGIVFLATVCLVMLLTV